MADKSANQSWKWAWDWGIDVVVAVMDNKERFHRIILFHISCLIKYNACSDWQQYTKRLTPGSVCLLWQAVIALSASSLDGQITKQHPEIQKRKHAKVYKSFKGNSQWIAHCDPEKCEPREARVVLSLMMLTSSITANSLNISRSCSSVICFGTWPTNNFTLSSLCSRAFSSSAITARNYWNHTRARSETASFNVWPFSSSPVFRKLEVL